jgi:hypothetical protein
MCLCNEGKEHDMQALRFISRNFVPNKTLELVFIVCTPSETREII